MGLHGFSFANYLEELGPTAQQDIYKKSSIDLALRDAFRKMRSFLMTTKGLTEDEAISLISIGVDFGVTQVVDGNWGIHAIIKKSLFAGTATASATNRTVTSRSASLKSTAIGAICAVAIRPEPATSTNMM